MTRAGYCLKGALGIAVFPAAPGAGEKRERLESMHLNDSTSLPRPRRRPAGRRRSRS